MSMITSDKMKAIGYFLFSSAEGSYTYSNIFRIEQGNGFGDIEQGVRVVVINEVKDLDKEWYCHVEIRDDYNLDGVDDYCVFNGVVRGFEDLELILMLVR